jgi:hypothetical protein
MRARTKEREIKRGTKLIANKKKRVTRARHEANRESDNAKCRVRHEANRQRDNARRHAWYEANRERSNTQGRAWREANPELVRVLKRRSKSLAKIRKFLTLVPQFEKEAETMTITYDNYSTDRLDAELNKLSASTENSIKKMAGILYALAKRGERRQAMRSRSATRLDSWSSRTPIDMLSEYQLDILFGVKNGQPIVRPFVEQKKLLLARGAQAAVKQKGRKPVIVRLDPKTDELIVGKARVSMHTLSKLCLEHGWKLEKIAKPESKRRSTHTAVHATA